MEAMQSIEKYGSVDTERHAAVGRDVERLPSRGGERKRSGRAVKAGVAHANARNCALFLTLTTFFLQQSCVEFSLSRLDEQGEHAAKVEALKAAEKRAEQWKTEAMQSIEKYGSVDTERHAAVVRDVERLTKEVESANAAAAQSKRDCERLMKDLATVHKVCIRGQICIGDVCMLCTHSGTLNWVKKDGSVDTEQHAAAACDFERLTNTKRDQMQRRHRVTCGCCS
jgi:hypothetical protein